MPRKFKVNIFTASVLSVLTSAATILVLSDKELGMLRTTHQQMLRILVLGKGCEKTYVDSEKRFKALTYVDVGHALEMPTIDVMLRAPRLKFLQAMTKDPRNL